MSINYLERELHNNNLKYKIDKLKWKKQKIILKNKITEYEEIILIKENKEKQLKKQMENIILKIHLLNKNEIMDFILKNELFKDKIINLNVNKSKSNLSKSKNNKIKSFKYDNIKNKSSYILTKNNFNINLSNKNEKKYKFKCEKILEKSKEKITFNKINDKNNFLDDMKSISNEKILKTSLNNKKGILNLNNVYSQINKIINKTKKSSKKKIKIHIKDKNKLNSFDFNKNNKFLNN